MDSSAAAGVTVGSKWQVTLATHPLPICVQVNRSSDAFHVLPVNLLEIDILLDALCTLHTNVCDQQWKVFICSQVA